MTNAIPIVTSPYPEAAKKFSFEIFDEHEQPVGRGEKSYNKYFSLRAESHIYEPHHVEVLGIYRRYDEDGALVEEIEDYASESKPIDGSEAVDIRGDWSFFYSDFGWDGKDGATFEATVIRVVLYTKRWSRRIIFDVKTGKIIHHNGALVFDA